MQLLSPTIDDVRREGVDPLTYGRWLTDALVTLLPDGRSVRVESPLLYEDHEGEVYRIPVGFVSDGATIPQFAWSLVGGPLDGRYRRAAILHDFQLVHPRIEAASVIHQRFYMAMRADNVTWRMGKVFYYAVKWFGADNPGPETT